MMFFSHNRVRPQQARREIHNAPPVPSALHNMENVIYWFGDGVYVQQENGLWISTRARAAGNMFGRIAYYHRMKALQMTLVNGVNGFVDGSVLLKTLCQDLKLPVATTYSDISEQQCRELAAFAQAWQFPWTWGKHKTRWSSHFIFVAPFLDKPVIYRKGD